MSSILQNIKSIFDSPRTAFDKAYTQNPNNPELRRIKKKLDLARAYREKSETNSKQEGSNATFAEVLGQSSVEVQKEAEDMIRDWHSNRRSKVKNY